VSEFKEDEEEDVKTQDDDRIQKEDEEEYVKRLINIELLVSRKRSHPSQVS
jgi:hypothetical protein